MSPTEWRDFWAGTVGSRRRMMHAGDLTLQECSKWASRAPHEVPLVNGEFAYITARLADACE